MFFGGNGDGRGEVRSDFVAPYSYVGVAQPGVAEDQPLWVITRIEMNVGFPTTVATLAVWDDRLTETYS